MHEFLRAISIQAAAVLTAVLLVGCGGGGAGTDSGTDGGSTPPVSGAVISGTFATGSPVSGTVEVIDAFGTIFMGNSATDGAFQITGTSLRCPCVLRGTADGLRLHSVTAENAKSDIRANITPISELVTAALAPAGDPNALFATPAGDRNQRIVASTVAAALAPGTRCDRPNQHCRRDRPAN